MDCDFVGHPVVSEPVAADADVMALRDKYGLGDAPILLVLPGSRRGEVTRLAPIFGAALEPVMLTRPDLKVVIPTTHVTAELMPELVKNWPVTPIILDPRNMNNEDYLIDKRAVFKLASISLAASGTVSLELAAAKTPMVIAYDMNWFSRIIISIMLKIDTVTLVNLVAETRTIPEFIGKNCIPADIGAAILAVLDKPTEQTKAMEVTMTRLGQGGEDPGLRAAKAVLARL